MKKPINIFAFVKKAPEIAVNPGKPVKSIDLPDTLPRISAWEDIPSEEDEDFNVSDKSARGEDENYCTASEGTIK